jgi:hypothetical protein
MPKNFKKKKRQKETPCDDHRLHFCASQKKHELTTYLWNRLCSY